MRKRYLLLGLLIIAGWMAGWYGQFGRFDVTDALMLGVLLSGTIACLAGWRITRNPSNLGFAAVFALAAAETLYQNMGGNSESVRWTFTVAQLCAVTLCIALVVRQYRHLREGMSQGD